MSTALGVLLATIPAAVQPAPVPPIAARAQDSLAVGPLAPAPPEGPVTSAPMRAAGGGRALLSNVVALSDNDASKSLLLYISADSAKPAAINVSAMSEEKFATSPAVN